MPHIEIDIDDFLDSLDEVDYFNLIKALDDEALYDEAESRGWPIAESDYSKYKQDSLLNQTKLDLFVAHINNISLEDVEKLTGTKFGV